MRVNRSIVSDSQPFPRSIIKRPILIAGSVRDCHTFCAATFPPRELDPFCGNRTDPAGGGQMRPSGLASFERFLRHIHPRIEVCPKLGAEQLLASALPTGYLHAHV